MLDPRTRDASIAADGTIAWVEADGVKVLRLGAATPRSVRLPAADGITQVRLAGGRLAVHRNDIAGDNRLRVSAPDGSGARRLAGQRGPLWWDFDGGRLAWVAQPCAQSVIQVWDLEGEPPPAVENHCARPRLVASSLRLTRAGTRIPIRLSCPPSPERGCAGDVFGEVRSGARKLAETYWHPYRIAAGETATTEVRIVRHKRLRGARRLVARVLVDDGSGRPAVKRLRLSRRAAP